MSRLRRPSAQNPQSTRRRTFGPSACSSQPSRWQPCRPVAVRSVRLQPDRIRARDRHDSPGLVRKGKVPVSNEILKIKLPRPAEADLPNGLHLIVLEDHRLPQISFQVIIPGAGGFFDPADQPGLASFTASLMREGTTTRTSNQISAQLDLMAATLNVNAGTTSTEATLNGSASQRSGVDAVRFGRRRPVCTRRLRKTKSPVSSSGRAARSPSSARNPNFLAAEMFSRAVYGTHPAARVAPTVASLDRTTREQLVEFHRDSLRARPRGARGRGRHLPRPGTNAGGVHVWRMETIGPSDQSTTIVEPAPIGGSKIYLVARPELRSNQSHRRHTGDRAHEPGLRRAPGDEQGHRRRPHRAVVPPLARRQGIHLRRIERARCATASWRLGGVDQRADGSDRTCAPRSARRNPAIARRTGPGAGARRRKALDDCLVCPVARVTRAASRVCRSPRGATSCPPTIGIVMQSASRP